MATTTPMMRQYLEIKSQYPDSILFFRLGDFYEMFMEDAEVAARILDITLTCRNKGAEQEIPLCGVPHHSCQPYINKLVENGHKVAICEQVEDPKATKGIVKREVVQVVTPGMVLDSELLDAKENNFLMAISPEGEGGYGVASVDISTGDFRVTQVEGLSDLESELAAIGPAEILMAETTQGSPLTVALERQLDGKMVNALPDWVWEGDRAEGLLRDFFKVASLEAFGCQGQVGAIAAAGAIVHYLQENQKSALDHINSLKSYQRSEFLLLDEASRRNLELTRNLQDGGRRGSLLGVLDRTVTAMGGRKLRHWLNNPLLHVAAIKGRQAAIGELVEESLTRQDLREELDGVYDLERLNTKMAMGTANAKDLVALKKSLQRLPLLRRGLETLQDDLLRELLGDLDPLEDVTALIEQAIVDDPTFVLREGGLISDGYDAQLDELRQISREGKGWIARMEGEERQRTGISNLRVRFNKVFGYYIEVTKSHLSQVPEDYERKQTLANAERYITPALKEYENKVLGAEERIVVMEYDLFVQVRQSVALHGARIQRTADALARLDALQSLAHVAQERNYVCPQVEEDEVLHIEEGRHPVIETMSLSERFVPNDVHLDTGENQVIIITGPNMAGKSTFMRQVALITLMAQMGSFVPAKSAHIGVVDRIFTRVGASDNLSRGLSTFMVEMNETANILHQATSKSLIVLDEIGRGTSTFDGVSIAWAVAEYLHDNAEVAARTLFATHYHELTDLSLTRERVKNFNVAVKEWNDQIVFLRRIVPGGASHSYGIQVARLAGLPSAVIDRAKEVLKNLEAGEFGRSGEPRIARSEKTGPKGPPPQLSLFAPDKDDLRQRLEEVDVSVLTPLEALNILDELKKLV